MITVTLKGGPGSGHHGHAGIPGKQGGSLPGTGFGPKVVSTEVQNNERRANTIRKRIIAGDYNPDIGRGKAPPLHEHYHDYKSDAGAEDVLNNTHDLRAMGEGWGTGTWNDPGSGARGKVKDAIVTQLSEDTGLPYDDVNAAVATWAYTSNDNDTDALLMQKAASEEFGLELSDWQKSKIGDLPAIADMPDDLIMSVANNRKLLRTMYANTQANFAMQGFKATDTITLYRGFKLQASDGFASTELVPHLGKSINWQGNAMESWSSSLSVASNFGQNVIAMEVPIRNIIGSCVTGFGCLTEAEFVVAGNTKSKARLIRAGGYRIGEYIPDYVYEALE